LQKSAGGFINIYEIIKSVPSEKAEYFENLLSTDKLENIIARLDYFRENFPEESSGNFLYSSELIMHSCAILVEHNRMLNPGTTPHRAIYSLGLDYEYDHPEIMLINGYIGDSESDFEDKYRQILRSLCKYVMNGNQIKANNNYDHLLGDYSLQVPLEFRNADFSDLAQFQMAFGFQLQDFYAYFTFNRNKINRNFLMPLVCDLSTYTG
jgi:hypothetical protein